MPGNLGGNRTLTPSLGAVSARFVRTTPPVDPVGSAGLVSPLELQIPMAGDALQDRERVLDGEGAIACQHDFCFTLYDERKATE